MLELVHDYPDKRVRLDVWRVLRYRGEVTAREGQPLRWVNGRRMPRRCRCSRPIGRSSNDWRRWRRYETRSADREIEANVLIDLHGACVDAAPAHEANREPVLPGADLGKEAAVGRQQDAHQARLLVAIETVLEQPARRDLLARLRGLAREPKDLGDGVANRPQVLRPVTRAAGDARRAAGAASSRSRAGRTCTCHPESRCGAGSRSKSHILSMG